MLWPRLLLAATLTLCVLMSSAVPVAVAADPLPPAEPLPVSVYRERRERVMKELEGGIAVLFARGEEDRDGFRQDSDFYYLTGIEDPDAVLVLAPDQRINRQLLFLSPRDPEAERWTGEREPIGGALLEATGFDRVRRKPSLDGTVVRLMQSAETLYMIHQPGSLSGSLPPEKELYNKLTARIPGLSVKNRSDLLPRMRSIKDHLELDYMEKAIAATLAAHRAAARAITPGVEENWIESLISVEFKKGGAVRPAFSSIVGSGSNSTILHYPDHDDTIAPGALVVVDIGAEYGRYAADVTRTYPANGRFDAEQRQVYETVLRAQQACIDMVKPGVYVEDLQARAMEIIREAGYGDYYIHGIGHFVGLDVHDAGLYGEPLEAGMVITVEPGIYIPEKKLGVRIEDEVLVTRRGSRLLTEDLPRSVEGIERMMRGE